MGKKTGPKGPSKPLKKDTFDELVRLIEIQCTQEEICKVLDMSKTTLNRRLKEFGEQNFEGLYKKHQEGGKASLRRSQWDAAKKGNPTMLVWLGKQVLGQRDQMDTNLTGNFIFQTNYQRKPENAK